MSRGRVGRFLKEIRSLERAGIISEETVQKIQLYYESSEKKRDPRRAALLVFGILGGLLVGGGIVLLPAHNWDKFSRLFRVALFLVPLVAVQITAGVAVINKKGSPVWRETVGILYFMLMGTSLAMTSQIYHIAWDMEHLLLLWAVGTLPIIHFLKADFTALLYTVLITSWAVFSQWEGANALLYWPLFGAVLPRFAQSLEADTNLQYKQWLVWVIILSLTVSLGVTLEKVLPGLWVVIYAGFFTLLFLYGGLPAPPVGPASSPRTAGLLGIGVLSLLLTFSRWWKDVGFHFIRDSYGFHRGAAAMDYIWAAAVILPTVYLYASGKVKPNPQNLLFSSILPLAAAGLLIPRQGAPLFRLYVLVLGFSPAVPAFRKERGVFWDFGLALVALSSSTSISSP